MTSMTALARGIRDMELVEGWGGLSMGGVVSPPPPPPGPKPTKP